MGILPLAGAHRRAQPRNFTMARLSTLAALATLALLALASVADARVLLQGGRNGNRNGRFNIDSFNNGNGNGNANCDDCDDSGNNGNDNGNGNEDFSNNNGNGNTGRVISNGRISVFAGN